jgi:hypothetical protein
MNAGQKKGARLAVPFSILDAAFGPSRLRKNDLTADFADAADEKAGMAGRPVRVNPASVIVGLDPDQMHPIPPEGPLEPLGSNSPAVRTS